MKSFISMFCFLNAGVYCWSQQLPNVLATSIDTKFKAKGKKYFGVATDKGLLMRGRNAAIIQADFGQVTPENSMKWESIERNPGQFRWDGSDYLVEWARNNSKVVRGHTFLWHSQLGPYVSQLKDKAAVSSALQEHITAVMGRYRGKAFAYDVANEILDEQGGFRRSAFHRKDNGIDMDEMVKIAFETARNADPEAKLYINDYNLDSAFSRKTQAMASKVKAWRAAGIPIDGIGSQAHLKPGQAAGVREALQVLCDAAPECAITELDIESTAGPEQQAREYATVVKACLEIRNCVGVTVWGVADTDSWRSDKRPLMFNGDFSEKAAYKAVLEVL